MTLPYFGQPNFGLHRIGPPSAAANIGVATATYVQAKPTIRINILTARFMDCSPCVQVPWEREPSRVELYSRHCRSKVKLRRYRGFFPSRGKPLARNTCFFKD